VRHGQLHLVPAHRGQQRHDHGGGKHVHEHIHV
jgi:hypothetical protein